MASDSKNLSSLVHDAVRNNDLVLASQILPSMSVRERRYDLSGSLLSAALRNSLPILELLLSYEADITLLSSHSLQTSEDGHSIQTTTLRFLVDRGFDINYWNRRGNIKPFLWTAIGSRQDLVEWALTAGADLDIFDPEGAKFTGPKQHGMNNIVPPLLDQVARHGTVHQFELLEWMGAPLGFRMLHDAVLQALDDSRGGRNETKERDERQCTERIQMIKYLVSRKDVDVNLARSRPIIMCPTALCIIAGYEWYQSCSKPLIKELAKILLDAGADPDMEFDLEPGYFWNFSATKCAGSLNKEFHEAVHEWKDSKDSEGKI